ncbi:MAG TPA: lysophospholipid acyltransferase family protein, partial [Gammaproteobacteria bacterium]|nr:lysophospholipid acyltransferase family protein [Gammaproteobacteria bacterium]
KGLEHGEQALAQGRGVILLSPHFTCLEMIGRLVAMQYSFTALFRPHKKKLINFLLQKFRSKQQVNYIPSHRMHLLTTALKNNQPVWYAYDVDGGKKRSVFAPFFGIQSSSLTAVSRLAKLTGAAILPIRFYRRDDNTGYEIMLLPALEQFPSNDLVADATRLNKCLEEAIRYKPEQYIWQYKRFKTRPMGEKRFYE